MTCSMEEVSTSFTTVRFLKAASEMDKVRKAPTITKMAISIVVSFRIR